MKRIGLIFPHQLFEDHPLFLQELDEVFLIEDSLFFGDKFHPLKLHKSKLVLHRASMKSFFDFWKSKSSTPIEYIEHEPNETITSLIKNIGSEHTFICTDPTDYLLEKRLRKACNNIEFLESPLFLNSKADNGTFVKSQKSDRFLMHNFYIYQRKRLYILMESNGEPTGGKWSFDEENRKKIPKKIYSSLPSDPQPRSHKYIDEAKEYVEKNFSENYGSCDYFFYPTNHADANTWFEDFLENRFDLFGDYEDAITKDHHMLYHSMLSPLLNIGLLTPQYIVEKTLSFAKEHNTSVNSLEGFIRQIIGWREYVRLVYEYKGVEMRNSNYWNHNEKLSKKFWTGETGLEPVDMVVKKALKTSYSHHIERLMIMGNSMFLLETNPHDTYRWFMEMYIDSYDWVMVPNVYGMSQHAAGNMITTKPYISGSNYIDKMSADYSKKDDYWPEIWNALYWSFIIKHKEVLRNNHRMHFPVAYVEKLSEEQIKEYQDTAQAFRESL